METSVAGAHSSASAFGVDVSLLLRRSGDACGTRLLSVSTHTKQCLRQLDWHGLHGPVLLFVVRKDFGVNIWVVRGPRGSYLIHHLLLGSWKGSSSSGLLVGGHGTCGEVEAWLNEKGQWPRLSWTNPTSSVLPEMDSAAKSKIRSWGWNGKDKAIYRKTPALERYMEKFQDRELDIE